MTRIDLLGSPVNSLDMKEALERIDGFIAAGGPHQLLVTNANKLWRCAATRAWRKLRERLNW